MSKHNVLLNMFMLLFLSMLCRINLLISYNKCASRIEKVLSSRMIALRSLYTTIMKKSVFVLQFNFICVLA